MSKKNKIPLLTAINEYNAVPIEECGEKMVQLIESDKLKIGHIYFKNNYPGSCHSCLVRLSVAKMLYKAAESLPLGFSLIVIDAWRPYKLQLEIYKRMFGKIKELHPYLTVNQVNDETSKFASVGSLNPEMPSPHFTGGSVDVSLVYGKGIVLNMGTLFDECKIESSTRFFEEKLDNKFELSSFEIEALYNRRILFHSMIDAGFTNYSNEWWHFDYGNQFWAKIKKTKAIYGLIKP